MKEESENIKNNRETKLKNTVSEFEEYYKSNQPFPENNSKLNDIELEACRLIAASTIQEKEENIKSIINDLGGYEKFVDKMCELAHQSAFEEADARIIATFNLKKKCEELNMQVERFDVKRFDVERFDDEKIDEMKLNFLSVKDTIKALREEKNRNEDGCSR